MANNINSYISTLPVYQATTATAMPSAINLPEQSSQTQPLENGSAYVKSYVSPQINKTQLSKAQTQNDPVINQAISALKEVKFLPGDMEYMKKLGVNSIFDSGEDAAKLIKDRGIKVEFGPVDGPKVHAQWEENGNKIIINEKYKNTTDKAVILAISEAMIHEAGHAKDNDDLSSKQEEFDCLALNTLANRYHQQTYPEVFANAGNSAILNDGVGLYTKLFFDPDPDKKALKARIMEKYGTLDQESPNHPCSAGSLVSNLGTTNK